MPYYGYYGGYGDFFANNIYCFLLIPVLLLSLWAQAQVSGNFKRYSGVANRRRLTGAQAAEAVLRAHGGLTPLGANTPETCQRSGRPRSMQQTDSG